MNKIKFNYKPIYNFKFILIINFLSLECYDWNVTKLLQNVDFCSCYSFSLIPLGLVELI